MGVMGSLTQNACCVTCSAWFTGKKIPNVNQHPHNADSEDPVPAMDSETKLSGSVDKP